MKKLLILLAVAVVSCTGSDKKPEVVEKIVKEIVTDTVTVEKVVIEKESNILQNENVKKSFLAMVDAVNNATPENIETAINYLDKDYAFKGEGRDKNIEKFKNIVARFKTEISDVKINSIRSSCDLAYLVVSFKKSIIGQETGVEVVQEKNKVGLFIMKKNSGGNWKLLIQKTDAGFSHWFYMPEE